MSDCQACGSLLQRSFVDLGLQPLANALVDPERAHLPDRLLPLHARVCDRCLLVQVDRDVAPDEIFSDYCYFSSFSESWVAHCAAYAEATIERFGLGRGSQVVEIGSNDGALLQYFVAKAIPSLGIEPAANVAQAAIARGVPTEVAFFGEETAGRLVSQGRSADLIAATNVLAHVPDIHDFVRGVRTLLKPDGVFVVEFPHLLNLIREVQFDTIYHEHFTYLSLVSLRGILERQGLVPFDAERQPTHGGSLRVFAARAEAGRVGSAAVQALLDEEIAAGLDRAEGYGGFQPRAEAARDGLLAFLRDARARGETVAGYGAAAKGNTLLNFAGITGADLPFVVDRNPAKQGRLLPGSRIPIRPVEALIEARPDHVLILPWNLAGEVIAQLPQVGSWGGRFVTAIPEARVHAH
ncbi:MAG TPA: class I SAM-dependent methyltransferase [Allosphingosinicella sp.]|jgi:SAM-dependent methyltransferase